MENRVRFYQKQFAIICRDFPFLLADSVRLVLTPDPHVVFKLYFPATYEEKITDIIQWDTRNYFEFHVKLPLFETSEGLSAIRKHVRFTLLQELKRLREDEKALTEKGKETII